MSGAKEIIVNITKCTGCRACEMACSFHHAKKFSPTFSSIEVFRNEEKGLFKIEIYTKGPLACDLCKDENEPLCIKYCSAKALDLRKG